jgi:hypothetical protein
MRSSAASPPLRRGGVCVTLPGGKRLDPAPVTPELLEAAAGRVRAGESLSGVARATGIAATTLHYRVKGRPTAAGVRRTVFGSVGHPSRLPEHAELELADLTCQAEEALVPLPAALLQVHARELYAALNGLALAAVPVDWFGKYWRKGWRKRMLAHGFKFSMRSVQELDAARAAALTPEVCEATFELWHKTVTTGNHGAAFAPNCVWIMDEIGCGGKGRQMRCVAAQAESAFAPADAAHAPRIGLLCAVSAATRCASEQTAPRRSR